MYLFLTKTAYATLALSLILFLLYCFRKNNNLIDFRTILKEHTKIVTMDLFTKIIFIIMPFFVSISCTILRTITTDLINCINTSLSIFVALLFAVAGILCSLPNLTPTYNELKRESFNEVLFESILTIFTLIFSFIILFIGVNNFNRYILFIISFCIYYLVLIIIMSILIIIKRLKLLFDENK